MQDISAEINGKYRQLCRLLISYNDFKHAADIAHCYLEGDYEVDREEWDGGDYYKKRVVGEALNCAMIISYARPFSGNDKANLFKIPDLPGKYLRKLDEKGREMHELIINCRNLKMAHSDSSEWKLIPQVLQLGEGRNMVVPVCEDTRAPLSEAEILTFISNCNIFMDAIIEARMDLEQELQGFLPKIKVKNDGDS